MNRRKLLSWFGLGWLASLLPSSLVGCSEVKAPDAPSVVPPSVAGNIFKAIGTVAQLDKDGNLLSDDKKIAVVRDPQDKNKVIAVNASCTHKGCTVKWKNSSFVCPCHDAEFAADGKVRQGPAEKSLQRYDAKIENGQVLVSST